MADSKDTTSAWKARTKSISQASETSQTAAEFIKEQLSLEAEAREALPYQFDTCTRDLGPLRQSLYACLTCNPAPAASTDPYTPAAVCYACSISCHGEHTLVELFNKRDFICDCGTTRMPESAPCTLRLNATSGHKGDVKGEEPAKSNKYNQNFRNIFCGCGQDYDAHQEKGTMFQCLGLGTVEDGGCGEDWWHPECLVGYTREEYAKVVAKPKASEKVENAEAIDTKDTERVATNGDPALAEAPRSINTAVTNSSDGVDGNDITAGIEEDEEEDMPLPPGFPDEEDFDHFICYKCLAANPWIKHYAGSAGFLPPVYLDKSSNVAQLTGTVAASLEATNGESKKRKASHDDEEDTISTSLSAPAQAKRHKSEDPTSALSTIQEDPTSHPITPKKQENGNTVPGHTLLPPLATQATTTPFSLFLKPDFRDHLCHCAACFPLLKAHPQLLEEEETYEPPVSEAGDDGAQSVGTGSLLDRGEAAFSNMDRVQAIQGAMAYAQLKDKVSAFLRPFAESGQAVGAEDVKAYFEKLRGDEQGIAEAAGGAKASRGDGGGGDDDKGGSNRKEQSGY